MLLPVAALYLNRPMPPGRALVDAGAAIALATDFNPGSAFCESLPVVCTLACTQLGLAPEEALAACTVNAAHVLGLPDRGRVAPGYRADLVLLDAPRLAAPRLPPRRRPRADRDPCEGGSPSRGHNRRMANQKQRRRRAKEKRHQYDLVEIDGEGNETVLSASEVKSEAPREAGEEACVARVEERARRRGTPKPPTWARVLKRAAIFAPIFLATVLLLGGSRITFAGRGPPDAVPARDLRAVQLLHGSPRLALAREAPREDVHALGARPALGVVARPGPRREDQQDPRPLGRSRARAARPGSKVTSVPTSASTSSSPLVIVARPSTTTTHARSRTWWSRSS